MSDKKLQPDWSKPPQGGIGRHGRPKQRSEPNLGRACSMFLLLTIAPLAMVIGTSRWFFSSSVGDFLLFLPEAPAYFFLIGITLVPLAALARIRMYGKMVASILRSVNKYIGISYGVGLFFRIATIFAPSLTYLIGGTMTLFGIGYFVVIVASAAKACVPVPDPPRPEFDPIMEGLEDFHPTDVGRVQDGIARF